MTNRIIVITNDLTSASTAKMVAEMEDVLVIHIDRNTRIAAEKHSIEISEVAEATLKFYPDLEGSDLGIQVSKAILDADNDSFRGWMDDVPSTRAEVNAAIDQMLSIRFGDYGISKSAYAHFPPATRDVFLDDNIPTNSKTPAKFLRENHRITKVRR